jgi:hypothetical protein
MLPAWIALHLDDLKLSSRRFPTLSANGDRETGFDLVAPHHIHSAIAEINLEIQTGLWTGQEQIFTSQTGQWRLSNRKHQLKAGAHKCLGLGYRSSHFG